MQPPPVPGEEAERLVDLHTLQLLNEETNPLFDAVTRLCQSLFGTPIALVSLVDEFRQWFASRVGLDVSETPRDVAFCAHAILDDDVFVVEDTSTDDRFADNPLVTGAPGIRFYAGAPVHSPRGNRLGTVCVIDTSPRRFSDVDHRNLRDLGMIVDHIIATQASSLTDALTGLYNRGGFARAVDHAIGLSDRGLATVTLAYADIDGLKALNDRAGHAAGDSAIRATAAALADACRRSDVVGRLGGDEFAVLLLNSTRTDTDRALGRIRAAFEQHRRHDVGLSIAAVDRRSDETAAELMARADRAMYDVKSRPGAD